MLNLQNHLPTMRNYGKLVANCGTKSSNQYERGYGKLVENCGTKLPRIEPLLTPPAPSDFGK